MYVLMIDDDSYGYLKNKKKTCFQFVRKKISCLSTCQKKISWFSGRRKKKDGLTKNNPGPPPPPPPPPEIPMVRPLGWYEFVDKFILQVNSRFLRDKNVPNLFIKKWYFHVVCKLVWHAFEKKQLMLCVLPAFR